MVLFVLGSKGRSLNVLSNMTHPLFLYTLFKRQYLLCCSLTFEFAYFVFFPYVYCFDTQRVYGIDR